jgi:hypothetical protein
MVYGMVSWSHGVRVGEPLAQWPVAYEQQALWLGWSYLADEKRYSSFFDSWASVCRLVVEAIYGGFSKSIGGESVGA